jgi:hypothetical protein
VVAAACAPDIRSGKTFDTLIVGPCIGSEQAQLAQALAQKRNHAKWNATRDLAPSINATPMENGIILRFTSSTP